MLPNLSTIDFSLDQITRGVYVVQVISEISAVFDRFLKLTSSDEIWDYFYPDSNQVISGYRHLLFSKNVNLETIQKLLQNYLQLIDKNIYASVKVGFIGSQFEVLNQLPILGYDDEVKLIGYNNRTFRVYPDISYLQSKLNRNSSDIYIVL